MPEEYSAHEGVHHAEHAHHLLEGSESPVLRLVPVAAAVLAVLAGLSSLYAGILGEQLLGLKDEAVLDEVNAADTWTEYQAESLKAHMYEIAAATSTHGVSTSLAQARKYRDEQAPLEKQARADEAARDGALKGSSAIEIRKSDFEIALAFFEVSIVLISIAAMIKRPSFMLLAGALGLVGLFFGLRGLL